MKKLFLFAIIASAAMLTACTNEVPESINEIDEFSISSSEKDEVAYNAKIDPDKIIISTDDAKIVASIFSNINTTSTRSKNWGNIENIVTIEGDKGEPLIYAVNYTDGYVLISASKKYYPILAIVEHGTFSLNMEKSGESVVIDELKEKIQIANKQEKLDLSYEWKVYESNDSKIKHLTKPTRGDEDIQDEMYYYAFDEWYCKYVEDYTDYMLLSEAKDILPDDVYKRFVASVSDEDAWEGTKFSWENTALLLINYDGTRYYSGKYMGTEWSQTGIFNTTPYSALGCVTVAVGQLMRYYQIPSDYPWSSMVVKDNPPSASTSLTDFLASLRSELNVSVDGGASIEDAYNLFKKYGYDCELHRTHNKIAVDRSITKNNPVYARGIESGAQAGHAWVIEASKAHETGTEYTVFRLADYSYPKFEYVEPEGPNFYKPEPINFYKYYYMNWGWGGKHNGWFLDGDVSTPVGNFSNQRMEITFN